MDGWDRGFSIGEAFHPWGTLFDIVAPGRVEAGWASVELPCPEAWGFVTLYAQPSAARPDRPVTSVSCELADTGSAPRYLFAELVKRLGQPDEIAREDGPETANQHSVVLHANWPRGKVRIGLSLYGAPRPSAFGNALGALYLVWTERDVAAAPFLPEWTAANEAAIAAADGARPTIFPVRYDLYDEAHPPPSLAELALDRPELLLTPPAIAARLGKTAFALWSDAAGTRWFLSTGRTTVALGGADTSRGHFYDVEPARGGGFTEIGFGPWSVRDAHGSRSIGEAVTALEALPGITIERLSSKDA